MTPYPNKLKILFPMRELRDYRRHLVALDDTFVVHRRSDGEFLMQLDPLMKLGARSYAKCFIGIAADLEAGYTFMIVDRDQFLADIEALARKHAANKDRNAVERAAQLIAEHTRYRLRNHLEDGDDVQSQANRMVIASRARRTKCTGGEVQGLTQMWGIPVPRTEQLWHTIAGELCDVRAAHRARAAWQRWTRANRPPMPTIES